MLLLYFIAILLTLLPVDPIFDFIRKINYFANCNLAMKTHHYRNWRMCFIHIVHACVYFYDFIMHNKCVRAACVCFSFAVCWFLVSFLFLKSNKPTVENMQKRSSIVWERKYGIEKKANEKSDTIKTIQAFVHALELIHKSNHDEEWTWTLLNQNIQ